MPFKSCYSRVDGKDTCCLGFSLNRTTGNCESKCTVYYILLSSNWYDKTNFHYFRHRYINTSSLRIIILCRSCSYCIWTKCINKFIFVRYILHFFVECSLASMARVVYRNAFTLSLEKTVSMYVIVLKKTATFLTDVSRELKPFHTRKKVCVFINIEIILILQVAWEFFVF